MTVTKDRAKTAPRPATKRRGGVATATERKESSFRLVPYRSLEEVRQAAGLALHDMAIFLGVSDKTLRRRADEGALNPGESLKAEMLMRTLDEARRVFRDDGKARRWITSPIVSLDQRRPLEHLDSIEGYERVKETLTKIEYGMY